ncbi:DNA repair and recombination protein radC [Aspergillus pseudodeflectus]|uniref:DNA repair and recombination protein radC n=1 Tax=Aspergillus pseudodeflectus TaxID=176178 RepID=A0ABR4JVD1_9EURO
MPNATGVITKNPFEESPSRLNQYTSDEIATLQARLEKKLGPEYISSRPGAAGQKVHYLSADKCINLANEVFGFNGWSSSIQNIQIDFVDEAPNTGKISLGLSVIVRVTLKDGAYHEDVGYGHIENCKGKAAAFEKAKKEATTDALKRALRNFGNVLGNCIYDKDYISKVTKVRTVPAKLDIDELHRHPDFAPIKREPVQPKPPPDDDDLPPRPGMAARGNPPVENTLQDLDAEFGSDVFDETDFNVGDGGNPDEIVVDTDPQRMYQPPAPASRASVPPRPASYASGAPTRTNPNVVTPSRPERPMNQIQGARLIPNQTTHRQTYPPAVQDQYANQRRSVPPQDAPRQFQNGMHIPPGQQRTSYDSTASGPVAQVPIKQEFGANAQPAQAQGTAAPGTPGVDSQRPPVVGFFSARGVDMLRDNPHSAATSAPAFDPHAESPSIRKTAGVDHTKSVPISKPMLVGASPAANQPRDFINPSTDMHRKIGAPGGSGVGSPMNRGPTTSSYRPLTRPNLDPKAAPNNLAANRPGLGPPNANGKRPPLNDVTNATMPGGSGPAPIGAVNDPKRARLDQTSHQQQHQQQTHPHPPQQR